MSGFTFFFSYARDDRTAHLDAFIQDLTERVRGRMGQLKTESVVFLDAGEIDIGEPWPEELIKGLQTSKVLVSLYTPLYFKRPICGQEVGFFQRREELLDNPAAAFVLPLLWIPCEDCIPNSLKELNYFNNAFPQSYRDKGMETLTRQSSGRLKDDYNQAIDAIAERICSAAKRSPGLPALPGDLEFTNLRNAFVSRAGSEAFPCAAPEMRSAGPNAVGFVYVAGTRKQLQAKKNNSFYGETDAAEWVPFASKRQMIGALAPTVAGSRNFIITPLALDETLADYIEKVEQRNSILVLIVDTWTLHLLPKYEGWMKKFDRVNSLHTSIIVVWNEDDLDSKEFEALLRGQISDTFATQSTREELFFRPAIKNSTEFETALSDTLIRLQDRIIQNKQTLQVVANSPFRRKPEIVNAG